MINSVLTASAPMPARLALGALVVVAAAGSDPGPALAAAGQRPVWVACADAVPAPAAPASLDGSASDLATAAPAAPGLPLRDDDAPPPASSAPPFRAPARFSSANPPRAPPPSL